MSPRLFRLASWAGMLVFSGSIASALFAQYDYSCRKSTCKFTLDPGATVKATLVRNHFGFGASINRWSFDTLKKGEKGVTQDYGDAFKQYFDYATPENEMKWPSLEYGDTKIDPPNFGGADDIVDFCDKNDIKVRGHNLFWNEKTDWLPNYVKNLNAADFKAEMLDHLTKTLTHYKGKVVQWDIINEIIHGENGTTPATGQGLLEKMSGDNNIFSWILDQSRAVDNQSIFVINDYNLTPGNDVSKYVSKCTAIKSKFDLIGDEGHFGDGANNSISKDNINSKVSTLVQGLNKHVWFTEVDWAISVSQSPDKMEELMRTCFSNPNIDGITLWVWCKRKMWRELTSYLVDSLLTETATGAKWRSVRNEFRTEENLTADASGKINFTGYQGKYRLLINNKDTGYVYLYPNDSTQIISLPTSVKHFMQPTMRSVSVNLNGTILNLSVAPTENRALFLSAYSISGKLISKVPLTMHKNTASITKLPAGCHVFRICSADKTYYTGMGVDVR